MSTNNTANPVISEVEALRKAMTLMGFSPEKIVALLQKPAPTAIDQHVFAAIQVNFQAAHVTQCGGSAEDIQEVRKIASSLRIAEIVRAQTGPERAVFIYRDFEDRFASLPFYLGRPVPVVDSTSRDLAFGCTLAPATASFSANGTLSVRLNNGSTSSNDSAGMSASHSSTSDNSPSS